MYQVGKLNQGVSSLENINKSFVRSGRSESELKELMCNVYRNT